MQSYKQIIFLAWSSLKTLLKHTLSLSLNPFSLKTHSLDQRTEALRRWQMFPRVEKVLITAKPCLYTQRNTDYYKTNEQTNKKSTTNGTNTPLICGAWNLTSCLHNTSFPGAWHPNKTRWAWWNRPCQFTIPLSKFHNKQVCTSRTTDQGIWDAKQ